MTFRVSFVKFARANATDAWGPLNKRMADYEEIGVCGTVTVNTWMRDRTSNTIDVRVPCSYCLKINRTDGTGARFGMAMHSSINFRKTENPLQMNWLGLRKELQGTDDALANGGMFPR
eukprot:tig00021012_g16982.t1